MRTLQLLSLSLLSLGCYAQNLVVNPGFEDYGSNDPGSHELRSISMNGWTDPTAGSSDISIEKKRNRHKYSRYSVEPDSGLAQGGFYASRDGQNWAEYLQGTLTEPLTKRSVYIFSVSIKNSSDDDPDVINSISISFSNNSRSDLAGEHESIKLIPDLTLSDGKKVQQNNEWIRYTLNYTANGGEQYFIIGTFDLFSRPHKTTYYHSPYFCCDNFSLTRLRPLGPIPDFVFENDTTATAQFKSGPSSSANETLLSEDVSVPVWNCYAGNIINTKTRRPIRSKLRNWLSH